MLRRHPKWSEVHQYWPQVGSKLTPNLPKRVQVDNEVAELRPSMAVVGAKMAAMQPRWVQI